VREFTFLLVAAFAFLCVAAASAGDEEAKETFGCEANPTGNPIGGGAGYRDIITKGDFVVRTGEELVAALRKAKRGQVVFVPDGTDIDVTGLKDLTLPAGAVLAGTRGLNGSPGPRLFTTMRDTRPLFKTGGDDVRLTGLRIEGPFGGTERLPTYAMCIATSHHNLEVDNCEIYNWNDVGVGGSTGGSRLRVHHCYIHHCTRGGLGYGVSLGACDAYIIANKFDHCRHHIASSGRPGCCYEAAWNLVMGHAISHHFDMHGGRDRGDSTSIAGDWMEIHHNTFTKSGHRAVVIRGVPSQGANIHHNWFADPTSKTVISRGNTRVWRNVYGPDKTLEE